MDPKKLANNLMFGCTECVPGDRAAAAACPVCHRVAKEVADRRGSWCPATARALALVDTLKLRGIVPAEPGLEEDEEDEDDDEDDDKHNVLDYDSDLSDADEVVDQYGGFIGKLTPSQRSVLQHGCTQCDPTTAGTCVDCVALREKGLLEGPE